MRVIESPHRHAIAYGVALEHRSRSSFFILVDFVANWPRNMVFSIYCIIYVLCLNAKWWQKVLKVIPPRGRKEHTHVYKTSLFLVLASRHGFIHFSETRKSKMRPIFMFHFAAVTKDSLKALKTRVKTKVSDADGSIFLSVELLAQGVPKSKRLEKRKNRRESSQWKNR